MVAQTTGSAETASPRPQTVFPSLACETPIVPSSGSPRRSGSS